MRAQSAAARVARRRVWIIGASTGIGAATAQALLAAGARVALSARQEDNAAPMSPAASRAH